MGKREAYRQTLRALVEWEPFLLEHSGLPGPRANLELIQAVAEEGDAPQFRAFLAHEPRAASPNDPHTFLVCCALVGLGAVLAAGEREPLETLRRFAGHANWRLREAVAMALQRWGDRDAAGLLAEMARWKDGSLLEGRAAAAALCEPRLLRDPAVAGGTLALLDDLTEALVHAPERKSEPFRVLRQALGYCWSVAVVARPAAGKAALERWAASTDPDVRWVVRENLKKKRLAALDAAWVQALGARIARR